MIQASSPIRLDCCRTANLSRNFERELQNFASDIRTSQGAMRPTGRSFLVSSSTRVEHSRALSAKYGRLSLRSATDPVFKAYLTEHGGQVAPCVSFHGLLSPPPVSSFLGENRGVGKRPGIQYIYKSSRGCSGQWFFTFYPT